MIQVQVPGGTFMPVTEPIEFSIDAPTWSLGKSMAAHITMGDGTHWRSLPQRSQGYYLPNLWAPGESSVVLGYPGGPV